MDCGKEMGSHGEKLVTLKRCDACTAAFAKARFYRAAPNPGRLLCDIFLFDDYSDIIGTESDVGATRIYTGSRETIEDNGMVMRHHIRSEEVSLDNALRDRLGWPSLPDKGDME